MKSISLLFFGLIVILLLSLGVSYKSGMHISILPHDTEVLIGDEVSKVNSYNSIEDLRKYTLDYLENSKKNTIERNELYTSIFLISICTFILSIICLALSKRIQKRLNQ
jgi:hypothetical protein